MNKLNFKTETEMQNELKQRISEYKEGQSRDGFIIKAEGLFEYKKIKYLIKVLRYYNHTNRFVAMDNRISDCHCVVEYPKETEEIVNLVKFVNDETEFLYHDSLHNFNDNQTVEEQINLCREWAHEDIDFLSKVIILAENRIKDLELTIEKIKSYINE